MILSYATSSKYFISIKANKFGIFELLGIPVKTVNLYGLKCRGIILNIVSIKNYWVNLKFNILNFLLSQK